MTRTSQTEPDHARERVARAIARAGLCSRRDAERLIVDGRRERHLDALLAPLG